VDKQSTKKISFEKFKEEFEKIYEDTEDYTFDIMGGEPLLQMDLVKKFIEYGNFRHFKINMMTNGFLLTKDIIEYLNEQKVTVSVSYDGLWQCDRGKDFSQDLVELIKTIKDLKIHCMWNGKYFNLKENHIYLKDLFDINPDITLVRDIGTWHNGNTTQAKHDITDLMDYALKTNTIPGFFMLFLTHILRYH
jgi:hypothetical protein